ncbi:MAG: heavy metal translocating P-type ATPase [Collinsella sp.]|nr:heavy metal translocating P-type ATPase [Collinsella sp.]
MNKKQKRMLKRIVISLALFLAIMAADELGALEALFGADGALWASFILYLVPYLVAGHDVMARAWRNIRRGDPFDENFLMTVATLGAFAMVAFPHANPHMAEGAAVMLFYQVGELFQSYAVGKSRKSIAEMMDIAPDFANLERDGELSIVDPDEVGVGEVIVVKPGERIPIDGIVVDGSSQLDTAALTGESMPTVVAPGDTAVSGCINMRGVLRIRTTKPFGESTVSRILELVENASEKKARTENLITRFARVYTPAVTLAALALAVIPPVLGLGSWGDWILRGLTFLVVSCPCALVISVPLSFFGGIGGASRLGILVKGSSHLEALSKVDAVVFDKTGTLTSGSFSVTAVHPSEGMGAGEVLEIAALAEAYSDHPVATSVKAAFDGRIDRSRVHDAEEEPGRGVTATVDGHAVLVGNAELLSSHGIDASPCADSGTVLHVAVSGREVGIIVIADRIKEDARASIQELHGLGVKRCIMLTGDREDVARSVARSLGMDGYHAQLLPVDKVERVEELLKTRQEAGRLAFVGDGINDAPVLMRADIGIAMGAFASDAAIEAADIVLMNDKPSDVPRAVRLARKTMRIVWQNIIFAIGVKMAILALAAAGVASMWLAVFGDVGVAVIAILNAMRAMNTKGV